MFRKSKKAEKAAVKAAREEATPKAAPATPAPGPARVSLELECESANQVFVAGSFNDWQPSLTPLQPTGSGRWSGQLELRPGSYEYLFVVDGRWLRDPKAFLETPNPFGGTNSVLVVPAQAAA